MDRSISCSVAEQCANYYSEMVSCDECRFGPNDDVVKSYWQPIGLPTGTKHPDEIKSNAPKKSHKPRKGGSNSFKVSQHSANYKKASRAEQAAYKDLSKNIKIEKSANSGRVKRDGDMKTGHIMIDFKQQSTQKNWTVKVEEMDKVRADALRNGKDFGMLLIENENGEKVFVLSYEDGLKVISDEL